MHRKEFSPNVFEARNFFSTVLNSSRSKVIDSDGEIFDEADDRKIKKPENLTGKHLKPLKPVILLLNQIEKKGWRCQGNCKSEMQTLLNTAKLPLVPSGDDCTV